MMVIVAGVAGVFWAHSGVEDNIEKEFVLLLADHENYQVTNVNTPLAIFLGGRRDIDVFVESKDGKVTRLGALIIGSPVFGEYYLEIPAIEMLKISF